MCLLLICTRAFYIQFPLRVIFAPDRKGRSILPWHVHKIEKDRITLKTYCDVPVVQTHSKQTSKGSSTSNLSLCKHRLGQGNCINEWFRMCATGRHQVLFRWYFGSFSIPGSQFKSNESPIHAFSFQFLYQRKQNKTLTSSSYEIKAWKEKILV